MARQSTGFARRHVLLHVTGTAEHCHAQETWHRTQYAEMWRTGHAEAHYATLEGGVTLLTIVNPTSARGTNRPTHRADSPLLRARVDPTSPRAPGNGGRGWGPSRTRKRKGNDMRRMTPNQLMDRIVACIQARIVGTREWLPLAECPTAVRDSISQEVYELEHDAGTQEIDGQVWEYRA